MRRMMTIAARVAPLSSTVLITGETGVGKERLARWLHDHSQRAARAFVAVNCAACGDSLLETELFGHARGAFTGAHTDRVGLVEAADGGTLFLDEIGDISATMQVKLLRVIQEREVRRVGETRTRLVDVRFIAATNRDLAEEVENRRFRPDLFYRLRVIDLVIPPLRERPEDLPELATHILRRTAARLRRPIGGYAPRVLELFLNYQWPGNIRELEHAVERACALATGGQIDLEDLPDALRGLKEPRHSAQPLRDRERVYIQGVVTRHQGDRKAAAKELGISLSTLIRRLRRSPADAP